MRDKKRYTELTRGENKVEQPVVKKEEKSMKKISKKALVIGGSIIAGIAAVGTTVAVLASRKHEDELEAIDSEIFDPEDDGAI